MSKSVSACHDSAVDRYERRAYTVEAIAEEIGKSPSWVRQQIRYNYLPAKLAGKTPLILADDFEFYLRTLPDA